MYSDIKKLSKDTFVYGFGEAATKLLGFVLIPLYTRFLTPADYGILGVILVLPQLLSEATSVGIRAAFYRFFFDPDIKNPPSVISTAFLFNYFSSFVILIILALFAGPIAAFLLGSDQYLSALQIIFMVVLLRNINNFGMAIFRVERLVWRYVLVTVVRVLLNLSLMIIFVAHFRLGVMGVLLGQVLPELLLLPFLNVASVGRKLKLSFSFTILRQMLRFGIPMVPINLSAWVVNALPVTLIAQLVSFSEAGLFTMGYKFGALIFAFIAAPFSLGWSPIAYAKAIEEGAREFYARVFTYLASVVGFTVLGISLVAGDLIKIMSTEEFFPAENVVLEIALGAMAYTLYIFFATMINITRRTYINSLIWVGAALLSIILDFSMIPGLGREGAGLAFVVTYLIIALTGFYAAQRVYPIKYEAKRLGLLMIWIIIIFLIGSAFSLPDIWLDLMIKILLSCSLIPLLVLSRFFLVDEQEFIRGWWHRRILRRRTE